MSNDLNIGKYLIHDRVINANKIMNAKDYFINKNSYKILNQSYKDLLEDTQ